MNARPVTDGQISRALRAHLPEQAAAGLRERVIDAAQITKQQRALPSFLGALSDADPVSRQRSLLIAAALLVALAFASAAAVGALRLLQRDPVPDLSIEPPADLPAFVLSSYERLPQLPPLTLTWHDSSSKGRVYIDRSGAVRFDRFTSAEATEPSSYTILSDHRISGMAHVESQKVWVEEGHEAIGDDPRVFLRNVLNAAEGPGCEMERDPDAAGNGAAATGWRYVGAEYVAGRPTHHVACVGEHTLDIDLWLDVETRLILRTREPETDDAGQPIPGQFGTTEVTEIAFGEQPAALFEPPEGIARMTSEAYNAYLCTRDLPNEEVVGLGVRDCPSPEAAEATPPEAEPTPPTSTPAPTVRPSSSDCTVPPHDPSEPTGPLTWTEASLKEDWPAPVRPEAAGGASVQPMPLTYIDPSGDTGSDVLPCVDIRDVTPVISRKDDLTYGLGIDLVSNQPPMVDPTELWIAYGVVLDVDRDGVPDWRYGLDNLPVDATGERPHRAWRTDLHTGQTERLYGPGYEDDLDPWFIGSYPDGTPGVDARLSFGGRPNIAGKGDAKVGIELDMPFYTWASVIQNGRVVATDYAPDAGWLLPSPDAKVGGTYVVDEPFPLRLSMRVSDGWTLNRGEHYVGPDDNGGVALTRDSGDSGLAMLIIDHPAKDACDPSAGTIDLGPSVGDLATFLAGQPLVDMSVNTDVTIDGYRGKYLEYTRHGRQEECGWGEQGNWPAISQGDIGESHQVWIIDVDGVRLVIAAFSSDVPGASETVMAEFRRIVDSIKIEP